MAKNFHLPRLEKISFLKQAALNFPEIFKIKDIEVLPEDKINSLFSLFRLNEDISPKIDNFLNNLENFNHHGSKVLVDSLVGELRQEEAKDKILNIFNSTVIKSTEEVSEELKEGIKKHKNIFLNGFLVKGLTKILQGILSFRKKIDEKLPGLSDFILDAAANTVKILVSSYCPIAGVILEATGILDKVKDALQCENLEKNINSLQNRMKEIEEDKKLKKIETTGKLINELANLIAEPSAATKKNTSNVELGNIENIQKLGLDAKGFENIIKHVKTNPKAKENLIDIINSLDSVPSTTKEIEDKLKTTKDVILEVAEKMHLTPELKKSFEIKLNEDFKEAEKMLGNGIINNKRLLEKIALQQETQNKILEEIKNFKKNLPPNSSSKELIEKFTTKVSEIIKAKFEVDKNLIKKATISPIIAKELGISHRMKILIERASSPALSRA